MQSDRRSRWAPAPSAPATVDPAPLAAVAVDGGGWLFSLRALGGPCEVRLDDARPFSALREQAEAACAEVRRIELRYSRYRPDSLLSRINAAAGQAEPVAIDAETAALLRFGGLLHAQSGGLFDLTSGVLRQAWDFRSGRLPTPERVEAARRRVGWDKVELGQDRVRLTEPGMELDLGGIGKEYAADRVASALQATGLRHGWVNLAGDIRVLGPRTDGSPWQFGIQHPRDSAALLATLALADGALATSGDYERYIEQGGRRYCHILDPRSGWPVGQWRSVSVVAPTCTAAGALTTLAMLMGPEALDLLNAQGVAFLAVDAQGRVSRSA